MSSPINFYADFGKLAELKGAAGQQDPKALREAARQFESLFTQMMLKSMRQANLTGPSENSLMDSQQTDFYRDMYDSQLAVQMSRGRGLGLAELLVKQLTMAHDKAVAASSQESSQGSSQSSPVASYPLSKAAESYALPSQAATPVAVPSVHHATPAVQPEGGTDSAAVATTSDANAVPNTATDTAETIGGSPSEFVRQMWPYAVSAARELGVDPHTLIAHAALETGWGKYIPCNADGTCSYNLFGIKAGGSWGGSSVGVQTLEYENGTAVSRRASFRAYASPADSFRDYAAFLKNSPRYADALGVGGDAAAFGAALQRGGYATDPNYANKLAATAASLRAMGLQTGPDAPNGAPNGALNKTAAQPLISGRGASA